MKQPKPPVTDHDLGTDELQVQIAPETLFSLHKMAGEGSVEGQILSIIESSLGQS